MSPPPEQRYCQQHLYGGDILGEDGLCSVCHAEAEIRARIHRKSLPPIRRPGSDCAYLPCLAAQEAAYWESRRQGMNLNDKQIGDLLRAAAPHLVAAQGEECDMPDTSRKVRITTEHDEPGRGPEVFVGDAVLPGVTRIEIDHTYDKAFTVRLTLIGVDVDLEAAPDYYVNVIGPRPRDD